MKRFKRLVLMVMLCSVFLGMTDIVSACTTFFLNKNGELIFGKNYDFEIGHGLVIVNKRGVQKFAQTSSTNKLRWVSKYGNITFNQFGKEFPSGGINESGLVIELMWLEGTEYPAEDSRPELGTLQWIQYQLDNHASVKEVIESDSKLRISETAVPLHYLVTDREGNTVTVEFLDGKMVYHSGNDLPYSSLANDTYNKSVDYIRQFEGFGGSAPVREGKGSLDRFVQVCKYVKEYEGAKDGNPVNYGFNVLDKVAQGKYTRWNIIYDIKNMNVHFRTQESRKIKNISVRDVDFSCDSPVQVIDINADVEGDIKGSMTRYTPEINRELLYKSYEEVSFLQAVPEQLVDEIAGFPEGMVCANKSDKDMEKAGVINNNGRENYTLLFPYIMIALLAGLAGVFIMKSRRNVKKS